MAQGVPALHPERKGELNVSPRKNYVEKRGGLPPYINSVATALVRGGMTRVRAIKSAISGMKKTCATGHWFGRPGEPVSAAIKGAACNAVRQWEQLKVATSVTSDARMSIELAKRWEEDGTLEFAWRRLEARAILELATPKPRRRRTLTRLVRAAVFGEDIDFAAPSAGEMRKLVKQGKALPAPGQDRPGRFQIRNAEDLDKAIRAVGRAGGEHDAVRRFIIRRAKAMGLSGRIPDNWQADGSLKS